MNEQVTPPTVIIKKRIHNPVRRATKRCTRCSVIRDYDTEFWRGRSQCIFCEKAKRLNLSLDEQLERDAPILFREKKELEEKLEFLTRASQSQVDEHKAIQDKVESDRKSLESQIDELKTQIQNLHVNLDEQEKRKGDLQTILATTSKKSSEQESELAECKTTIKYLHAQIKVLREDSDRLKSEMKPKLKIKSKHS